MMVRLPDRFRRGLALVILVVGIRALIGVTRTVLWLAVWRTHWQPGLDIVRRYQRAIGNRKALKTAGEPADPITAIHHTGRTSGMEYVTPVWAERVGDSFYIQLPYGKDVDWVRNVVAAGSCSLENAGVRYLAVGPAIVGPAEAVQLLSTGLRLMQRLADVESYLRLDIASEEERATAVR